MPQYLLLPAFKHTTIPHAQVDFLSLSSQLRLLFEFPAHNAISPETPSLTQ